MSTRKTGGSSFWAVYTYSLFDKVYGEYVA